MDNNHNNDKDKDKQQQHKERRTKKRDLKRKGKWEGSDNKKTKTKTKGEEESGSNDNNNNKSNNNNNNNRNVDDDEVIENVGKTETITEDALNETSYLFRDHLRCVKPYMFTFSMACKGRMVGLTVLDLYCKEFPTLSREVYLRKIQRGDITVNKQIVPPHTVLTLRSELAHRIHRHEPAVTAEPITVIFESDEIVVVNKPASIPVHPCGRYRHNSVLFILSKELGYKSLYLVHRLDRLTSGVLLLAKSSEVARKYSQYLIAGDVHKTYVAKVKGEFPIAAKKECEGKGKEPESSNNEKEKKSEKESETKYVEMEEDGGIFVDQPILVQNHRLGLNMVSENGKEAKTKFYRLWFDPVTNTSLVKCCPLTGRTHQIRVHLQFLGHPIVNDPLYNDDPNFKKKAIYTSDGKSYVYNHSAPFQHLEKNQEKSSDDNNNKNNNNNNNNNNTTTSQSLENSESQNISSSSSSSFTTKSPTIESQEGSTNIQENEAIQNDNGKSEDKVSTQDGVVEDCADCSVKWLDPSESDMVLFLHALEYEGKEWKYVTPFPKWAQLT